MRTKTNLFTINGLPILAPDQGLMTSFEDLDASDSGRDESGVMHRTVSRFKVGRWEFRYSKLTEAELQYMESLFPEAPYFDFGHPSRLDSSKPEVTTCYRSKYSAAWYDAVNGVWNNYAFNIIEC